MNGFIYPGVISVLPSICLAVSPWDLGTCGSTLRVGSRYLSSVGSDGAGFSILSYQLAFDVLLKAALIFHLHQLLFVKYFNLMVNHHPLYHNCLCVFNSLNGEPRQTRLLNPLGGVDRLVLGVVNWGCLSKLEMTIQTNASRKGGKHMTINMSNYVLGDDIPVDEMILGGIITLEQN